MKRLPAACLAWLLLAVLLVGLAVALLFRQYGMLQYDKQRNELSRVLDGARTPIAWTCEEPWPDLCQILSIDVGARQRLLEKPEPFFQMRALQLSVRILEMALEPDVALFNLDELLTYLESDAETTWRQSALDVAAEQCSFGWYDLSRGYRGALCLGTIKGLALAVDNPTDGDSTREFAERGCASAFVGAGWLCEESSVWYPELAIAASTRRSHLKLVKIVRIAIQRSRSE